MYHKTPTYFRKGRVIRHVEGATEEFKSISAAKRRSRELQKASPPMGNGYLRVERD
jgi:hypothetical protein